MLFNRVPCFFYNHLKNKPSLGASCISNKIIIYDKLKKNNCSKRPFLYNV